MRFVLGLLLVCLGAAAGTCGEREAAPLAVGTFLAQHCGKCHSGAAAEADIDLAKLVKTKEFGTTHETWRKIVRVLEKHEMPPAKAPQPDEGDRSAAVSAIRSSLKSFYARTQDGDPGQIVLRRLTNSEYDYTIEDLTGVPLAPTWRFPRNESSGEGFDNVAAALGLRSSALMEKYLEAAEDVASHAFVLPSRGLMFSRLSATQSSRPQRYLEAAAALKAFYDRVAAELPKRADLSSGLVAAWQFQHRGSFDNADLAALAAKNGVDPRYAEWLWKQLHDASAGPFQRHLLQEPFAALPKPGAADPDAVSARCRRIAGDIVLTLHDSIGHSEKDLPNPTPHYIDGRQGISKPRQKEWGMTANGSGGVSLFLLASDAGVAQGKQGRGYVVWQSFDLSSRKGKLRVVDLLKQRPTGGVVFDRLPDGQKLKDGEFAVPVPSLIEVAMPADFVAAKESVKCRARYQLSDKPACVAQVAILDRPPTDARGTPINRSLPVGSFPEGRVIAGGEILATGDHDAFQRAWDSYDELFQRFGLPYFPRIVDLDINERRGFPPTIGMFAVYGIPPERHLHRFEGRDRWLAECILTPEEGRQLEALWDDVFYLSDEDEQRLVRLGKRYGPEAMDAAARDAALAKATDPEIQPRGEGRPFYVRLPDSPARRYAAMKAAPAARDAKIRSRSIAELVSFADRAWRRPLDADEQRTIRDFYANLRSEGLDDEAAVRRSLVRILVSPSFILKVERNVSGKASGPVSALELASRLSYFLWSSAPDDELRKAAADGSLVRDDILKAQTLRMLRDPRSKRLAVEFFGQWLGFKNFDRHSRVDRERFPDFTEDLRQSMSDETILFLDDLIRNDRSIRDLFFGSYTFLNAELAIHYGLNPAKLAWPKEAPAAYRSDWVTRARVKLERSKKSPMPLVRVPVDPKERGGVLGMGSVLTATSLSLRTSPVNRGKWLYETLLGRDIPEPPPDAGTLPDDDRENKNLTLRQQLELHRRNPTCASCHARFDPLGFALERFDAIGQSRERDAAGRPIDDRGELAGEPIVGLSGVRAYLQANEEELLRNFSRKLIGFGLSRALQPSDELLIDRMRGNAKAADERFSASVLTVVLSPQFRNRRGADAPREESK